MKELKLHIVDYEMRFTDRALTDLKEGFKNTFEGKDVKIVHVSTKHVKDENRPPHEIHHIVTTILYEEEIQNETGN